MCLSQFVIEGIVKFAQDKEPSFSIVKQRERNGSVSNRFAVQCSNTLRSSAIYFWLFRDVVVLGLSSRETISFVNLEIFSLYIS